VGRFADLATDALLVDLGDLASAHGYRPSPVVARLLAYDRRKGTQLLATLNAWLHHMGETKPAAAYMCVHPNTFRYRLRRAFEVGGLDPDDTPQALNLMLEFKLVELQSV